MIKEPLITVFVPVYNLEAYIQNCIDSILKQTYTNLEIILIDDGSQDNSLSIMKQYQEIDCRIKVIEQAHLGVPQTRTRVRDLANGDFISMIDGDDLLDENLYKTVMQYKEFDIIQYGFVPGGKYDVWKSIEAERLYKENYSKEEFLSLYFNRLLIPALWQRVFRKEVYFKETYRNYYSSKDDHFNFPHIVNNASSIRVINQKLYTWNTRMGSIGQPQMNIELNNAEARFMSGLSILDFVASNVGLSEKLLQLCANYLESYLCQTAKHCQNDLLMDLEWMKKCYLLMKNNIDIGKAYLVLPLHDTTRVLFLLLENYDQNKLRDFLGEYLKKMDLFLNKFTFNG